MLRRLAATYGKSIKVEQADEYYRHLHWIAKEDFDKICDDGAQNCKSFPSVKTLLEIAERFLSSKGGGLFEEVRVTLPCDQCSSETNIDLSQHTPKSRYPCNGAMAKGFKCPRVFDDEYVRKLFRKELADIERAREERKEK